MEEKQPKNALIIDDEEIPAKAFIRILKSRGFTVTIATTIEEARAALLAQQGSLTIILCDTDMPKDSKGVFGNAVFELISELKAAATSGARIVLISGGNAIHQCEASLTEAGVPYELEPKPDTGSFLMKL